MNFTQLADIADRYACDKGRHGPSSHWSANNYVDIYQAYLDPLRNASINLLEIGLGVLGPHWDAQIAHGANPGGASMKMWSEYLPNAAITGLDINPASYLNTERVKTYVVDQGSRDSLSAFLKQHPDPTFDVIIDDGSHRADHQQVSLEVLWPHLKPSGLYFIEDLNDFAFGGRAGGGRFAAPDTISTREFFRRYAGTGEISEPNAFNSTAFLSEVTSILFHSPRPLQRPRDLAREVVRTVLGRARYGVSRVEWLDNSERIVVLRKWSA